MNEPSASVKRKKPRTLHPKDWDRRALVLSAMSARHLTMTELARRLDVSVGYVSAIVWGRRRIASAEQAIAKALGTTHDALFASSPGRAGRAA